MDDEVEHRRRRTRGRTGKGPDQAARRSSAGPSAPERRDAVGHRRPCRLRASRPRPRAGSASTDGPTAAVRRAHAAPGTRRARRRAWATRARRRRLDPGQRRGSHARPGRGPADRRRRSRGGRIADDRAPRLGAARDAVGRALLRHGGQLVCLLVRADLVDPPRVPGSLRRTPWPRTRSRSRYATSGVCMRAPMPTTFALLCWRASVAVSIVPGERGAHAGDLVRGDLLAVAGAADHHAEAARIRDHLGAGDDAVRRVVVLGVVGRRADVDDVVTRPWSTRPPGAS